MAQRKVREEEQEHLHAAFLEREISPDVRRRLGAFGDTAVLT
jgi:hypothetical protein